VKPLRRPDGFVFSGDIEDWPISNMTMLMCLRRLEGRLVRGSWCAARACRGLPCAPSTPPATDFVLPPAGLGAGECGLDQGGLWQIVRARFQALINGLREFSNDNQGVQVFGFDAVQGTTAADR
jgi:hypothetical protein